MCCSPTRTRGLAAGAGLRLAAGFGELQRALLATVTGARECLVAVGSRSRDAWYLAAIEEVLARIRPWCATGCCSTRLGIRC